MTTKRIIGWWWVVCLAVSFGFLIGSLNGCASWPKYYYPEARELRKIANKHINCAVVSVLSEEHLRMTGIESKIVCNGIPMDTEPTLLHSLLTPDELTVRGIVGHCWLEVINPVDGKPYLLDPALGLGGYEVKYYPERYEERR